MVRLNYYKMRSTIFLLLILLLGCKTSKNCDSLISSSWSCLKKEGYTSNQIRQLKAIVKGKYASSENKFVFMPKAIDSYGTGLYYAAFKPHHLPGFFFLRNEYTVFDISGQKDLYEYLECCIEVNEEVKGEIIGFDLQ